MHPSKRELRLFIEDRLEDSSRALEIADHLKLCDFYSEFCENYRLFIGNLKESARSDIPQRFHILADKLYQNALAGRIIDLKPLMKDGITGPIHLAADGKTSRSPGIYSLATLCSEDPELVLRVMRDSDKGYDYIQLIGDKPEITSQILIRIPEMNMEFITDHEGKATLENPLPQNAINLKWQIKMPDAVFSLEPLVYDPEKTEYKKDFILETEKNDKINITFEGKTEGKKLLIRILELDGRTDFGPLKIALSQKGTTEIKNIGVDKSISFDLDKPGAEISIRLFQ